MPDSPVPVSEGERLPTVADLATLYLGNLLYALERCALSLADEDKPEEAAFYRGIGRALAESHGRSRQDGRPAAGQRGSGQ